MKIDTIFENGAFRPLKPLAIPENQRVEIQLEDFPQAHLDQPAIPKLRPSVVPDDAPAHQGEEAGYQRVPPREINRIPANLYFAGKRLPPVVAEESM